MDAYDLARKNYPKLWTKEMLKALVKKTSINLTPEQYEEITGEEYTE